MTTTTKAARGGKRPGSGRPRLVAGEITRRVLICITEAQHVVAGAIGDGNVSLGIRRALDAWKSKGEGK